MFLIRHISNDPYIDYAENSDRSIVRESPNHFGDYLPHVSTDVKQGSLFAENEATRGPVCIQSYVDL